MEEIRILQLGKENWNEIYTLPEWVRLEYVDCFEQTREKPSGKSMSKSYDMCFLDRTPLEKEIDLLYHEVKAYTLFITKNVEISGRTAWLCCCKKAQHITTTEIQKFLLEETKYYYPKPYGEKFRLGNVAITQGFFGKVKWNGNYSVVLNGKFGDELRQAVFWRGNIPIFRNQEIDLWLEYTKDASVEISLVVTKIASGSLSDIIMQWEFTEKELENVVRIQGEKSDGMIFVSLQAKGEGELQIVALHDRYSRGTHGYFLPGGERFVTTNREEVFCYFEPGDLKPPLNVYFSGYKTMEGFEGYYMMKGFKGPFLLVSEARLEGGAFYMGEEEYEKLFIDIIKKYMKELGFTSNQVILSGLSMGTYGALYYGCDIRPHAIILGKPLASIGNVAANEKYLRPGGFPTSLDVLQYQSGGEDGDSIQKLNERFWNKFDVTDWGTTKFIVSYMLEDDYDASAYDTLISHLDSNGVQLYGKGIHGRHNDNTSAIVSWFVNQYKKVLYEDFVRGIDEK